MAAMKQRNHDHTFHVKSGKPHPQKALNKAMKKLDGMVLQELDWMEAMHARLQLKKIMEELASQLGDSHG